MKKLHLKKRTIVLSVIACILAVALVCGLFFYSVIQKRQKGRMPYLYTAGKVNEFFTLNEEQAKRIDDSQPFQDGETWAIYMYLNGSNLELDGHSQLSNYVEYIANAQATARKDQEKAVKKAGNADMYPISV